MEIYITLQNNNLLIVEIAWSFVRRLISRSWVWAHPVRRSEEPARGQSINTAYVHGLIYLPSLSTVQ
jgi:hypothetical protein